MTDVRNEINMNKVMEEAIRVIADKLFEFSQLKIIDMGISDTGFLLRSGTVRQEDGKSIINYSAPYSWQIEKGRMPGSMPPVEALEKWVHRKLGVSKKEQRRVAWAIAMKIRNYGTHPQPFMEESIMQLENTVIRIGVAS